MDNNINQNNQDIFARLGLNYLSDTAKKNLLDSFSKAVHSRVVNRIMDRLSEEDQSQLDRLMEAEKYDEADKMLDEKIPDITQIYGEETEKFLIEMKEEVPAIRAMVKEQINQPGQSINNG